jgi:sucrose 6(F)-phosphate phosphorylase
MGTGYRRQVSIVRNAPQLITYPDSLGGNLRTVADLLDGPLDRCFGGVHVLPPFPSSGDRGFAPIDYRAIDARFGTWDDLGRIGASHDLALDLIVNHVSRRSDEFRDFEQRGRQSPFADLFLTLDKVWPGGEPDPAELSLVFRRRERPYSEFAIKDTGEVERVWTTFGADDPSEQIDIDVNSPIARRMLAGQLAFFAERGVRLVRLDAVGYAIKRAGTSCFMVEPEIHEFLAWLRSVADSRGLELLTEVHGDVAMQRRLAEAGDWSYDFALPGLVLHAVLAGTAEFLVPHLRSAPARVITMLDSHDGIPIQPDLDGALPLDQARIVVDACLAAGGNVSRVFTRDGLPDPAFDAHQANCTWYAAIGRDDEAYLMTRAIQLFSPGIPQVYYVGLLAGDNDRAAMQATGDGRAVNRHDYRSDEISAALERPVVRRLLDLLRLRREHPAFAGSLEIGGDGSKLSLAWRSGDDHCALAVDLAARSWAISGADG